MGGDFACCCLLMARKLRMTGAHIKLQRHHSMRSGRQHRRGADPQHNLEDGRPTTAPQYSLFFHHSRTILDDIWCIWQKKRQELGFHRCWRKLFVNKTRNNGCPHRKRSVVNRVVMKPKEASNRLSTRLSPIPPPPPHTHPLPRLAQISRALFEQLTAFSRHTSITNLPQYHHSR